MNRFSRSLHAPKLRAGCYSHEFVRDRTKENSMRTSPLVLVLIALIMCPLASRAATAAPHINIAVDATDAPRKILHAQLTIPATAGTLTLYYPKWIPGEHAPSGPVIDLTGVKFTGNGQL